MLLLESLLFDSIREYQIVYTNNLPAGEWIVKLEECCLGYQDLWLETEIIYVFRSVPRKFCTNASSLKKNSLLKGR